MAENPARRPAAYVLAVALLTATAVVAGCNAPPKPTTPRDEHPRTLVVAFDDGHIQRFVLPAGAGLIVGVIRDEHGKPIAGIHVALLKTDDVDVTSETGQFLFANITAASYDVRVDANGWRAAEDRVSVLPGVVTRVWITMWPAAGEAGAQDDARRDPSTLLAPVFTPIVSMPLWIFGGGLLAVVVILALMFILGPARRPDTHVRRGRRAFEADDLAQAEKHARKALARDASHAQAWILLGTSLIQRGRYSEAVGELTRASTGIDPQMAGIAFLITLAYQRMGEPKAARKWLPLVARDVDYWEALEHDPETAFKSMLHPGKPRRRTDPAYA